MNFFVNYFIRVRSLITAPNLPENEPFTDFTNPAVVEKLQQAFETVSKECKDVPIVIGGEEYRTDDVHYQVSVNILIYSFPLYLYYNYVIIKVLYYNYRVFG